ncbi:hypothetical protein G3O08_06605 [Cryomorpha ignava]|uniref:Uncharacterized protein n=1 Tax=Cryomorpha ignava TaxID=101383 RepID=A0A7K3WNR5_9FLAO|nr:hypothetical protein [Cryomorpha ignava]NEN23168.1 hypothetical protein [Cryomorpha ignava]
MTGNEKRHIKDHLPKHSPDDSVWDKIDAQLNSESGEKSKNNSKKLKIFLPQHNPSENVWNEIDHKLAAAEMRSNLPKHEPDDELWTKLEAQIEQPEKTEGRRYLILKWAAVLILALGSAVILKIIINDKPKLEYHVEWEDAREPAAADTDRNGWDGIAGNELIEQLCLRSKTVCETPEFKNLEEELIQLEKDRAEIEAQINPYADNGKLERMLVHLEIEHSKIVNEMTRKLL